MDLALDANGDLDLENADLYFVKGADAVKQFISNKLRFFLAEWFLDETGGIPYFDQVFVKNPSPIIIDTIFKTQILDTPGVVELLEFSIELDGKNRKATITFRARTEDGEIDFSETLGA